MITKVSQIDTPKQWVSLKYEYDRNQTIPVELKTSRQHSRWAKLRHMLRCRWQVFTETERQECVNLYGPINPPGA